MKSYQKLEKVLVSSNIFHCVYQIYIMYVRQRLDFCDVIYHLAKISNLFDSSFRLLNLMAQIEMAQYQAALAVKR